MIFVDTGAFLAMFYSKDKNYLKAQNIKSEIQKNIHGKMITTNYILDELITLLRGYIDHKKIITIVESIKSSTNIIIIWITKKVEENSWNYFKKYQDKEYSFTDCSSFVIMNLLGIKKAFSYDNHFSQAGYQRIY